MISRVVVLLVAETPLAPSTGVGLGEVDRPVQRDPSTGLPVIRGSALRGALRHYLRARGEEDLIAPSGEASGPLKISVGDARLIALPVPSNSEFMVWLTSPYLLGRFESDAGLKRREGVAAVDREGICYIVEEEGDRFVDFLGRTVKVKACYDHSAAMRELTRVLPKFLQLKLLILDDRMIREAYDMGLGRRTRVRLSEEKTVERGKLWVEEYFPQYSIFYLNMFLMKGAEELLERMSVGGGMIFPVGSSSTLGFGLVRVRVLQESS